MGIVYLALLVIFYISLILIKKSEKKQNLVLWMNLNILIIICYHIAVTLLFYLIHIKSTLLNLSILIVILLIILGYIIIKTKTIQKYEIKKQDIVFAVILFAIIIIFAYKQYNFPFNIKYNITDSSVHYLAATDFYEYSDLLANKNSDYFHIHHFESFMTGAYTNIGILFKIFSGIISQSNIYVFFDLSMLYIFGMLFYELIIQKVDKNQYLITYIFTIICLSGYIMNIVLSGFQYLLIGLVCILGILLIYQKWVDEEEKNISFLIMLFLLNLGLFFSYYFFVPVVYGAILIDQIVRRKKEILKLNTIVNLFWILILPSLLGIFYFVIKEIIGGIHIPATAINVDGAIYKSKILNFLLFMPFILYYIIKKVQKKKYSFSLLIFFIEIFFTLILYIGNKISVVSEYYLNKSYYLLWILNIYISFKSINILLNKKRFIKITIYMFSILYCIMIIGTYFLEYSLIFFDIYRENMVEIKEEFQILSKEEIEVLNASNKHIEKNDIIAFTPSNIQGKNMWIYALVKNPYILTSYLIEPIEKIEEWIDDNKDAKYLVYLTDDFNFIPEENNEFYEIVYKNNAGGILIRK